MLPSTKRLGTFVLILFNEYLITYFFACCSSSGDPVELKRVDHFRTTRNVVFFSEFLFFYSIFTVDGNPVHERLVQKEWTQACRVVCVGFFHWV